MSTLAPEPDLRADPAASRTTHAPAFRLPVDPALAAALLVGTLVRLVYVIPSNFPLNDGGLFFVMARDLQHHHFILPSTTSYNADGIPFAYPPLMPYVIALLDRFTPFHLLLTIRFLPLLANIATIPAVYLLGRKLLPSRSATAAAVLAFAVLVGGFEWHIMGGGITRAFGLLFAVLAAHQACRVYLDRNSRAVVPTIVLASAAMLSHPNMLAPLAVALLFALHDRSWAGVRYTAIIGIGVLFGTSVWWGVTLLHHGIEPFFDLRASRYSAYFYHDGYPWRALLDWSFTDQPLLNWPALFGIIGVTACVARRRYFVPLWLLAEFVAEPTQAHNFVAPAVALLVGIGLGDVVLPGLWRLSTRTADEQALIDGDGHRDLHDVAVRFPQRRLEPTRLAGGLILLFVAVVAVWSAVDRPELWYLRGLSSGDRADFAWIAEHTPADASFLVLSDESWWADGLSEWFPALTGRHSDYTAQGYEWLGIEFPNRIYWHDQLQSCGEEDAVCLDDIVTRSQMSYDYVYVPASCCGDLRDSILGSPQFVVVHESEAGLVAAVQRPGAAQ